MMLKRSLSFTLGFFLTEGLSIFHAPDTKPFGWTFSDSSQQGSQYLTECQSLQISIVNDTNVGTAPYYLMAFEPGGFSTTTFIGTNRTNLNWQVNHAAGIQLLLSMADAVGNPGGTSQLYTVIAGADRSCITSHSTSLVITANVTKDLSTCEPWGLTIAGGVQPYNVILAAVGASVITNITIPQGFDVLTYINRAYPNSQMLAAVSDATGQFGQTTSIVNTIGSSDVGCDGLSSTTTNSTQRPSSVGSSTNTSSGAKSKHRTVVIAICGVIGGLVAIISATVFILCMRKKVRAAEGAQDMLPRTFKELNDVEPLDSLPRAPVQSRRKQMIPEMAMTNLPAASASSFPSMAVMPSPGIVPHTENHQDTSEQQQHTFNSNQPLVALHNPAESPLSAIPVSEYNLSDAAGSRNHISTRPFTSETQPLSSESEPDITIQHRDGGVVQELPPPYLDRPQSGSSDGEVP